MTDNIREWEEVKAALAIGTIVNGVVVRHAVFGIFVRIAQTEQMGFIERLKMIRDGFEDYPPIGSTITATVLGFREYSQQVELTVPKRTGDHID